MGMHNRNCDKYFIVKLLLSIMLFFILLRNLGSLKEIWIINDEFGYWGAAAFFAGKDWGGLMGSTPYYAFGYGIILAPLYALFSSPETIYQAAIILNVCLVCGGFWLAIRFGNIMFPKLDKLIIIFVAFLISLYPNTVAQSQIAWPETLLIFLFWVAVNIFISIVRSGSTLSIVLLAIIMGYMYTIHQRTLGIIVSATVVLFLLTYTKRISWKKLLLFLTLLVSGILIQVFIKGELKEVLWKANNLLYINDYAGQAGKVNTIFSLDGVKRLIQSFLGKIFYLGGATLMLNLWGGWYCYYEIKEYLISIFKKKKVDDNKLIVIFVFCANILTYFITSIFLIDANRVDIVIYGRYNEIVIAPLIFCGIYQVWRSRLRWKEQYINSIIMILMAVSVNRQLVDLEGTGFNAICSIGMFKYFHELDSIKYFSYYIASKVIIISTVYLFVCCIVKYEKWKKLIIIGMCISMSYLWVGEADLFIEKSILPAHERITNDVGKMAKGIESQNIKEIYYVQNDTTKRSFEIDNSNFNIKYLQFYLPDTKIQAITYSELPKYKKEKAYLCFPSDSKLVNKLSSEYELVERSQSLKVYKSK